MKTIELTEEQIILLQKILSKDVRYLLKRHDYLCEIEIEACKSLLRSIELI